MTGAPVRAPELVHEYADAGIRVLPLHLLYRGECTCGDSDPRHPVAKHPLPLRGKDAATTDHDQIERWTHRWPVSNWGGVPPEGVFVLDVDPRNGGYDSLSKLELAIGPLPLTLSARTGGGGLHLWLSGAAGRSSLGRIYPGIDIKTPSGYVVLPPSVHRSGQPYEWLDKDRPAAYAPTDLLGLLAPPVPRAQRGGGGRAGSAASVEGLVRTVLAAQPGTRNDTLFWAACRVAEQGGDPQLLAEHARTIGLADSEIAQCLGSAAQQHGRAAR